MSIFNKVKLSNPPRNTFDLSHERKLSLNMGELVPFYHEEVVPGDTFQVSSEIMMRLAPMLAPIMHRVNVTTHYFFVPNRLIWDEWEDFITGGSTGLLTPEWPHLNVDNTRKGNYAKGMVGDYFGFPDFSTIATITDPIKISVLPFRAYLNIWNEYYRDQNLMTEASFSKASGLDPQSNFPSAYTTLRKRCWEKDYFTSALPWSQRGGDVTMPFEPQYKDVSDVFDSSGNPAATGALGAVTGVGADGKLFVGQTGVGVGGQTGRIENLESGAGVTINDLRTATALQRWLERNARGGSRYIEQILAHFKVKSSDARLQRPEYLGGGIQPIVISEVLSTVSQEATGLEAPQGNMSGHGISVGKSNRFKRFFEEHGQVIGIMSVLPKTAYFQGIPRKFTRTDKTEYYWPEFAHLGEQEIKDKEIFVSGTAAANEDTFGYTPRYAEYKYACDSVHGDFRDTLEFWHMARKFNGAQSLNTSFVQSDPTTRIFAVEDGTDALYAQVYHRVQAKRPMPYFGTPRL